jgi:hypothetical protein
VSNAVVPVAFLFDVIRRCEAGECCRGCLCDRLTVNVDVDELTDVEVAHFQAHGTAVQRAEIATYFASEVPVSKPLSKCVAPAPVYCCRNAARGDGCTCSEAMEVWESTCPPGCPCLICLVDGLSANPSRKVKAA